MTVIEIEGLERFFPWKLSGKQTSEAGWMYKLAFQSSLPNLPPFSLTRKLFLHREIELLISFFFRRKIGRKSSARSKIFLKIDSRLWNPRAIIFGLSCSTVWWVAMVIKKLHHADFEIRTHLHWALCTGLFLGCWLQTKLIYFFLFSFLFLKVITTRRRFWNTACLESWFFM